MTERFTATFRSQPLACHARHCEIARRNTKCVSGPMRPVRSAIEMKSSGGNMPYSGCCQAHERFRADDGAVRTSRAFGW